MHCFANEPDTCRRIPAHPQHVPDTTTHPRHIPNISQRTSTRPTPVPDISPTQPRHNPDATSGTPATCSAHSLFRTQAASAFCVFLLRAQCERLCRFAGPARPLYVEPGDSTHSASARQSGPRSARNMRTLLLPKPAIHRARALSSRAHSAAVEGI